MLATSFSLASLIFVERVSVVSVLTLNQVDFFILANASFFNRYLKLPNGLTELGPEFRS